MDDGETTGAHVRPRARRSRRRLQAVGVLGLGLVLGPLLAVPATGATPDPAALRDQTAAAAGDLGVRDDEADAAAVRLQDATAAVDAARTALTAARDQLTAARADLGRAQAARASALTGQQLAQQDLDRADRALDVARDQLRDMIRAALQSGIGGDLDVLLQSGTPDELADRLGVLDHLSEARNARIAGLADARDALAVRETRLVEARQRASDAVRSADAQVDRVAALVDDAVVAEQRLVAVQGERQAAFDSAQVVADAARARYAALQQASADLTALLAARGRADRSGPPRPVAGARGPAGLIMPVAGVLTSRYGYRTDPLGRGRRFHSGQDFGAPTGTPILAATAGTVAYAGWANGYGNYTCVDRGSGFATCYGHQTTILVAVGQPVQQGQQIGLVGSTGNSTGPHLHFEVRIDGRPVDPMPYLP